MVLGARMDRLLEGERAGSAKEVAVRPAAPVPDYMRPFLARRRGLAAGGASPDYS